MKTKRKEIVLLTGVMIILVGLAFLLLRKPAEPEKVEKLRVGVFAICAPVYIAQQQVFFKRHSLDVSIENYQAGLFAVNDLLADKVDVATAAELVLAIKGFKASDLRTIGTHSAADTVKVIARRDRGIERPGDLRGRMVGVTKNTISEFFLHTFLSFDGIRPAEIRMVDLKPSEIVTTLSEGRIDAASCFAPFSDTVEKNLAGKAISWSAQGGREFYGLLITREEFVKTRPRAITGLLKGVLEAEKFLKKNEREAQDIVKSILGIDQETLMNTWSKTRFLVRLDQDLLTLMEDEGRWAIKNKLVDAETIPDYSTFLYLEGLRKIKPEAVGVTH